MASARPKWSVRAYGGQPRPGPVSGQIVEQESWNTNITASVRQPLRICQNNSPCHRWRPSAKACNTLGISDKIVLKIFDNYDQFLSILDDQDKRSELANATSHDGLRQSTAWREIRDVSAPFHEGLVALFLEGNDGLKGLTMRYGIF